MYLYYSRNIKFWNVFSKIPPRWILCAWDLHCQIAALILMYHCSIRRFTLNPAQTVEIVGFFLLKCKRKKKRIDVWEKIWYLIVVSQESMASLNTMIMLHPYCSFLYLNPRKILPWINRLSSISSFCHLSYQLSFLRQYIFVWNSAIIQNLKQIKTGETFILTKIKFWVHSKHGLTLFTTGLRLV